MTPEAVECRHCKRRGYVPEIVPYWVGQHVWLHPGCAPAWFGKYREWARERQTVRGETGRE